MVSWQGRRGCWLGKGHPDCAGRCWGVRGLLHGRGPMCAGGVCVKWGPGEGVTLGKGHTPCGLGCPLWSPLWSFCPDSRQVLLGRPQTAHSPAVLGLSVRLSQRGDVLRPRPRPFYKCPNLPTTFTRPPSQACLPGTRWGFSRTPGWNLICSLCQEL